MSEDLVPTEAGGEGKGGGGGGGVEAERIGQKWGAEERGREWVAAGRRERG